MKPTTKTKTKTPKNVGQRKELSYQIHREQICFNAHFAISFSNNLLKLLFDFVTSHLMTNTTHTSQLFLMIKLNNCFVISSSLEIRLFKEQGEACILHILYALLSLAPDFVFLMQRY
jgi:hypothetical protein